MAGSARGFPVTLESWGWSQKGDMRPENQDSFLSWNERLLWAVADGVGSSAHGGEAGRLVTRMLLTTPHAASLDEHVNNVGGILRQGNDILRAHGGATQAASTVVALLMHGGEAASGRATAVAIFCGTACCTSVPASTPCGRKKSTTAN